MNNVNIFQLVSINLNNPVHHTTVILIINPQKVPPIGPHFSAVGHTDEAAGV